MTASCSRPAEVRQIKRPRHLATRKREAIDDQETDSDVSSDDEDVSGLVRITIISKRKKIKLFESLSSHSGVKSSNTSSIGDVSTGLNFLEMLRQSQGSTAQVEIPGSATPNDEGVFGNPYTQKDTTDLQSLFGRSGYVEPNTPGESVRYLYDRSKARRYEYVQSHIPKPSEDSGDETIEVDGVVTQIPSENKSPLEYLYGDSSQQDVPDEEVNDQTPPMPATGAASGSGASQPAPLQKPRAASESDAKKHGIPAGYSLKWWDPDFEPLLLLGSVFDSNALGKWIYDWSVYAHGTGEPIPDIAGELWLLVIQLYGKVKRAEEAVPFLSSVDDRETLEDFIESGDRLHDKLQKLLTACEDHTPAFQQAKKDGGRLGKNAGVEFVNTLFGRDAELPRTERFMGNVRLFNLRFDANCNEILDKSRDSKVTQ